MSIFNINKYLMCDTSNFLFSIPQFPTNLKKFYNKYFPSKNITLSPKSKM